MKKQMMSLTRKLSLGTRMFLLMGMVLGLSFIGKAQNTYYVNGSVGGPGTGTIGDPFKSLQTAINTAATNDTIKVAAGTYKPDVNIPGGSVGANSRDNTFYITKAIALAGGYNSSFTTRDYVNTPTILDGDLGNIGDNSDNAYHVVTWNTGDNTNQGVFDGFVVQNGTGNTSGSIVSGIDRQYGGGLVCYGGKIFISNNKFLKNSANYCAALSARSNAVFTVVRGNLFDQNTAFTNVGALGIESNNTNGLVELNTFTNNKALNGYGGAMFITTTTGTSVRYNTFTGNTATTIGAVLYMASGTAQFNNNTIVGNTGGTGAAVYIAGGTFTYGSNIISGNKTTSGNYDLYLSATTTNQGYNLLGNTNTSYIATDFYSDAVNLKRMLPGDTAAGRVLFVPVLTNVPGRVVQYIKPLNNLTTTTFLQRVPLTNWSSNVNTPQLANGDYVDQTFSTLTSTGFYYAGSVNLSGISCAASTGIWYVDANTTNEGDGSTATAPTKDLSALLRANCVNAGDTIKVAAGTYYPNYMFSGGNDNRDKSFYIDKSVSILGGYTSTFTSRNVVSNPTILSGNIGDMSTASDNAYHVVLWNTTDGVQGLLDGFIIQDGTAATTSSVINGVDRYFAGGLFLYKGNLQVSNNKFYNNTAAHDGAVRIHSTGNLTLMRGNWFDNNSTTAGVAAAVLFESTQPSTIELNTFTNNVNKSYGTFYNNAVGVALTLRFNTFVGNTSQGGGAAAYYTAANTKDYFYNNTVMGNVGTTDGAVYFTTGTHTIANNILTGNNANVGAIRDLTAGGTVTNLGYNLVNSVTSAVGSDYNSGDTAMLAKMFAYTSRDASLFVPALTAVSGKFAPVVMPKNSMTTFGYLQRIPTDSINMYNTPKNTAGTNYIDQTHNTITATMGLYTSGSVNVAQTCPAVTNKTWYVDINTVSEGNGTTAAAPTKDLSALLRYPCLSSGDTIKIAKGTYYPNFIVANGVQRDRTFFVDKSISILGGYTSAFTTRDFVNNPTILSGDIGVVGDSTDNAYHVMLWDAIDGNQGLIDGLIMRDGMGMTSSSVLNNIDRMYAGALYHNRGKLQLTNNKFCNNISGGYGAVFVASGGNASPQLTYLAHNLFDNNQSVSTSVNGGAMGIMQTSSFTAEFNTFTNNTTGSHAALYYTSTNISNFRYNTFVGNTSTNAGGISAFYSNGGIDRFYNNTVMGNKGGTNPAVYFGTGTHAMANNLMIGNRTTSGNRDFALVSGTLTNQGYNVCNTTSSFTSLDVNIPDSAVYSSIFNGVNMGSYLFMPVLTPVTGKFTSVVVPKQTAQTRAYLNRIPVANMTATNTPVINGNYVDQAYNTINTSNGYYTSGSISITTTCPNTTVWYVDSAAAVEGDGSSIATPSRDLSALLQSACVKPGDTIKVAKGTYIPSIAPGFDGSNQRLRRFLVNKSLVLLGGYTSNFTEASRNYITNKTILEGDYTNNGDNMLGVNNLFVWDVQNDNKNGVVEGFIFRRANGGNGSAFYLNYGNLQMRYNEFYENNGSAGILYMSAFGNMTLLRGNWFHHNTGSTGSGVSSDQTKPATIELNTFNHNASSSQGALFLAASTTNFFIVRYNTFAYNTSTGSGAAVYINSNVKFYNNTAIGNSSTSSAYPVYLSGTKYIGANVVAGNRGATSNMNLTAGSGVNDGYSLLGQNSTFTATDLLVELKDLAAIYEGTIPFTNNIFQPVLITIPGQLAPVLKLANTNTSVTALRRVPVSILDNIDYTTLNAAGQSIDQTGTPIDKVNLDGFYHSGSVNLNTPCPNNPARTWYVNVNSSTPGDGTAPAGPLKDLSSFLISLCLKAGDTVKVAAGTYIPMLNRVGSTDSRARTFYVDRGIALMGGYDSTFAANKRDVVVNRTILEGDWDQDGNLANNTYNVMQWNVQNADNGYLEGFEIRDGWGTSGVGLMHSFGNLRVNNNRFVNNTASGDGAGIYVNSGNLLSFTRNHVDSNSASGRGGGIYFNNAPGTAFTYNTITNNKAANAGGICFASSAVTMFEIRFNTIASNTATSTYGAAMYLAGYANFFNNTVVGNSTPSNSWQSPAVYADGPITFGGNLFGGNKIGINPGWSSATDMGTTSGVYPVNKGYNTYYSVGYYVSTYLTDVNDIRLYGSELPLILGGSASNNLFKPVFTNVPKQFAPVIQPLNNIAARTVLQRVPVGNLSVFGVKTGTRYYDQKGGLINETNSLGTYYTGSVEGVEECPVNTARVWYVDINSANDGDATTPSTAAKDLTTLLRSSCIQAGDTVKVAEGVHYPTFLMPGMSDDRDRTFYVPKGIHIIGGYNSAFNVRNACGNKTILHGNWDKDANIANNTYHIMVWDVDSTKPGTIDGFVFREGSATATSNGLVNLERSYGAGLYLRGGDLKIYNSAFKLNQAIYRGAGIYASSGAANGYTKLLLSQVDVDSNSVSTYTGGYNGYGGGIFLSYINMAKIDHSTFYANSAYDAPAIYAIGSSTQYPTNLDITYSTIVNNLATVTGSSGNTGAIYYSGVSTSVANFYHNMVMGNKTSSTWGGYAVSLNGGSTFYGGNIIAGNENSAAPSTAADFYTSGTSYNRGYNIFSNLSTGYKVATDSIFTLSDLSKMFKNTALSGRRLIPSLQTCSCTPVVSPIDTMSGPINIVPIDVTKGWMTTYYGTLPANLYDQCGTLLDANRVFYTAGPVNTPCVKPVATPPANIAVCNRTPITAADLKITSDKSNTVYSWMTTDSIGMSVQSKVWQYRKGSIPAFIAVNNTQNIITDTVKIVPVYNGCNGDTVMFTITVYPTPIITLPTDKGICLSGSTTLTAVLSPGASVVRWTITNHGKASFASAPGTNTTVTLNGNSVGFDTVYCVAQNAQGCLDSVKVNLSVNNPVTMGNILPLNPAICGKNTVQMTTNTVVPGGLKAFWMSSNPAVAKVDSTTGVVTGQNVASVSTASISFYVESGCAGSAVTTTVTVNPMPVINPITAARDSVCVGATLQLSNTTPGGTWRSSKPASATINASGLVTGVAYDTAVYMWYVVSNGYPCTDSVSYKIKVQGSPTVAQPAAVGAVCAGNKIWVTVPTVTTYGSVIVRTGWLLDSAGVVKPFNPATQNVTYDNNGGNLYYYVVSSCGDSVISAGRPITVYDKPTINVTLNPISVCEGSALPLPSVSVNANGQGIYSQYWVLNGSTYTPGSPVTINNHNRTLYYTATNGCGTTYTSSVLVTVNAKPGLSALVAPPAICANNVLPVVVPTKTTRGGGTTIIKDGWLLGSDTIDITKPISMTYNGRLLKYFVKTTCGDTVTDGIAITLKALPEIPAITGENSICQGKTTRLSNIKSGGIWKSANPSIASIDIDGLVTAISGGEAEIRYLMTNTDGCTDSVKMYFNVLALPTIDSVPPVTICNGSPTNIYLTGLADNYSASSSNPSIVVAAFQSSDPGQLTLTGTNRTTAPMTATITIKPISKAGCQGTSRSFQVVVNPQPIVLSIANQYICSGDSTQSLVFPSNVPGTKFNWESKNKNIGLTSQDTVTGFPKLKVLNQTLATLEDVITVTPVYQGCLGTPTNFHIFVNPRPAPKAIQDAVYCLNQTTSEVSLVDGMTGATYGWVFTGDSTIKPAPYRGTTSVIPSFKPVMAGSSDVIVRASYSSYGLKCMGGLDTFRITINPLATVNLVNDKVICNGDSIDLISFTGSIPGTTFRWTNDRSNMGLAASGSGNIAKFKAINTGNAPVTATITVTPEATQNGLQCTGNPITFTITVNPTPNVVPQEDQYLCSGTQTKAITFKGTVPGTIYNWTNNNSQQGFPNTGSGDIEPFTVLYNPTPNPLSALGIVTPTYTNAGVTCYGTKDSIEIFVLPYPQITNTLQDQAVCNGTATNVVKFTGITSSSFLWTNDHPNIGLPSSGKDSVPSFIASNTTTTPITATIKVTPQYTKSTLSSLICYGEPQNIQITVNPTPKVDVVMSNQEVCTGMMTEAVPFAGVATTYRWTSQISGDGIPTQGVGNIPSFRTINNGTAPLIDTIVVTPEYTNSNYPQITCTNGTSATFFVTINPLPKINNFPVTPAICSGSTFNYTPTSATVGAAITWERLDVEGIEEVATNGSGAINEVLTNTKAGSVTVTYRFTIEYKGCTSVQDLKVIVRPAAVLTNAPLSASICNGSTYSYTAKTSTVGTTFNWTRAADPAINGGVAANGATGVINETLTNNSDSPVAVTYKFTLASNGCSSNQSFDVVVNPTPRLTSKLRDSSCCHVPFIYTITTATQGGAPAFSWVRLPNANLNGGATTSGNTNTISESLSNSTPNYQTAIYQITTTVNGCSKIDSLIMVIKPMPSLTSPLLAKTCSGETFNYTPVVASDPGTTFEWKRLVTAGIAEPGQSGTGNISETLTNMTNSTIQVTYLITGTASTACTNHGETLVVNVEPTPRLSSSLANSVICSGNTFNYSAASLTPAATFTWTRDPIAGINGGAGNSGTTGNISEVLTNSTSTPIQVVYRIKTTAGSCTNNAGEEVKVTVNPTPTISSTKTPADLCSGSTFNYQIQSNTPNAGFVWFRLNNSNISESPVVSSTNIISEKLTNTSATPTQVSYIITTQANGCANNGDTVRFNVMPVPSAVISNASPVQMAINGTEIIRVIANGTAGTWESLNPAIVSVVNSSTTGGNDTATIKGMQKGTTTLRYRVQNASGCITTASITINVEDLPTGSVSLASGASPVVCSGGTTALSVSITGGTAPWQITFTNGHTMTAYSSPWVEDVTLPANTGNVVNTETYTLQSITYNNGQGTVAISGTPVDIKVNPVAKVTTILNDTTLCAGGFVSLPALTSNVASNVNYTWTNNNPNIGLYANGSGNISFLPTNNMGAPMVGEVVVTPVYTNVKVCPGESKTFHITVNPKPVFTLTEIAPICEGTSVALNASLVQSAIPTTSVIKYYSDYACTSEITAPVSPSVATTYFARAENTSCLSDVSSFSIRVTFKPDVDSVAPISICSGSSLNIPFTGTVAGSTFTWTRSVNANIAGIAQSGIGMLTTNSVINRGNAIDSVEITVIPTNSYNGIICTGAPRKFKIYVNPSPRIDNLPSNQTICAGTSSTAINFNGVATRYVWTCNRSNIGLAVTSGINGIPAFVGVNSGSMPIVATFKVTPQYINTKDTTLICDGQTETFTITVNSQPMLSSSLADQKVCDGEYTSAVTMYGTATSFRWTNDSASIGLPISGIGNIPSFRARNNGNTPITSKIIVIPEYENTGTDPQVNCNNGVADTFTITVYPRLTAGFANATTGLGEITFTNQSANANSYLWDFGDGSTSTAQNPAPHTYALSGNYTVTLTTTSDGGCTATTSKVITVNTVIDLKAAFAIEQDVQCLAGNSFRFINQSTLTTSSYLINEYKWNFGDGATSTVKDPTHTYSAAGTYTVTLIVTETPGGTADSIKKTVKVITVPTITDGAAPAAVCEGGRLRVNMPTIAWNGNATTAGMWLLDGTVFDPNTTNMTMADSGKILQYRVVSTCGESTSTGVEITVNRIPVANFGTSVAGLGQVTFTDQSIGAAQWAWDFGDGSTSTLQNPATHTYAASGTYTVSLTIKSVGGCSSFISKTVVVNKVTDLQAAFSINSENQCLSGNNFSFISQSKITTPGFSISNYKWNFGDGSADVTTQNATHTYTTPGTYTVTLTVTETPGGTTDSIKKLVKVTDIPAITDGAAPAAVCEGGKLRVNAPTITWNGNPAVTGTWLLDGAIIDPNTMILSIADSGKVLTYSVNSTCGEATSTGVKITVNRNPVANFGTSVAGLATINFTDLSVNAVSWAWEFGDGNTSTAQNPAHTYAASGTYTVTLTVKSAGGCSAVITKTVVVNKTTDLQAAFSINSESQCLSGNNFSFISQSKITTPGFSINSYKWNFGDGSADVTTQNAAHVYTAAGTYVVTLTVTETPGGTTDSIKKLVKVTDVPVVTIPAAPAAICEGQKLNVAAPTITWNGNPAVTGMWMLNGAIFDPNTTILSIADSGKLLTYSVNSTCGEAISAGVKVVVNRNPVANFGSQVTGLGQITFTDQSTNAASWAWDFGDGNTSTAQNPVHTYTSTGSYQVTLTVKSAGGCTSSTTKTITVGTTNDLQVAYSINNGIQCLSGNSFTFKDQSTITTPSHSINSWKWNFGDGSAIATTPTATHSYAAPGTYTVTLIVTETPGGTTDSLQKTVTVLAKPVITDGAAPAAICEGNKIRVNMPAINWNGNAPVNGTWLLNGSAFDPNATILTMADSGKVLKYMVTSTCGDTSSVGVKVIVNRNPVADFTTTLVGLGTISLTNASVNADTYVWNFGDGTTDANQTPANHTYASSGTYTITLTAKSTGGCTSTISKTVTVVTSTDLQANFDINNGTQCVTGNSFLFKDLSRITTPGHTVATWKWNFGDGSAYGTTKDANHTYAAPGTYTVTLTVSETPGNTTDSVQKTVRVLAVPVITDGNTPLPVCEGNKMRVSMPTINWNGNTPVNGTWLLDGQIIDPSTTILTMADSGKVLKYSVVSACGPIESSGVKIMVNRNPVADFTSTVASLGTINFTNKSTNADSYVWNFGDGNMDFVEHPTHTYTASGTYTVTLTAKSVGGCTSTISKTVTVFVSSDLQANFNIVNNTTQCLSGNNFTFKDMSKITIPNHSISTWQWNFGDGTTANTKDASHSYAAEGTYTVTLKVTETPGGTTDSVQKIVVVLGVPTIANDANPAVICEGNRLSVKVPTINWKGNTAVTGTWLLNGNVFDLNTVLTASDSGKLLQYQVMYACGTVINTGEKIVVTKNPVANFATALTGLSTVTFTDKSTNAVSWAWDFGDGSTDNTQNPVHAYASTGNYNVTLTVKSAGGCSATTSKIIAVSSVSDLQVAFDINEATQCLTGNVFSFKDQSHISTVNHSINSWKWNFGDGTTATTRNATHTYAAAGTYTVTLIVTETPGGTSDSIKKTVKVIDIPNIIDGAAPAAICENNKLSVNAPIVNWNGNQAVTGTWLLNGSIFDPNTAILTIADSGKLLQYRVASTCGEVTSTGVKVIVNRMPVADFTTAVSGIGQITFTNKSTNATAYAWNFGDGSAIVTTQNAVHTYAQSGSYNVTLTVTSASGCTSSITKMVAVSTTTDLEARFTVNEAVQCLAGNNFVFKDNSRITTANHSIGGYKWYFGNGDSASTKNATYSYTSAGSYVVTLVVTETPGGTQSSFSQTVKVLDRASMVDTAALAKVCEGGYLRVQIPSINWNGNAPVAGTWLIDGTIFDPTTRPMTMADNGKLLQYRIATTCGVSLSTGRAINVVANPTMGTILDASYCAGVTVPTKVLGNTAGVTYQWKQTGDDIGLVSWSGNDSIPAFTATNNGTSSVTARFEVTPFNGSCKGNTIYFNITVAPKVKINSNLQGATICSGTSFQQKIESLSDGVVFNWTRLADANINNGTTATLKSSLINEILTNTGVTPVTIKYIITATTPLCTSASVDTLNVTVNPMPTVNNVDNFTYCNNQQVMGFNFTGTVPGTTYQWEQITGGNSNGMSTQGVDSLPSFIAKNHTESPIVSYYKVKPVYTNGTSSCTNNERTFMITVNPTMKMVSAADMGTICSDNKFEYEAKSGTPGAIFNWTRPACTGLNNDASCSGNGCNIKEVLCNVTAAPITTRYIYTLSYGGCSDTSSVSVTVLPTPNVAIKPLQVVCGGVSQVKIPYVVSAVQSTLPMEYSITFGQDAQRAGFEDIAGKTLSSDSITLDLPASITAGFYSATVSIKIVGGCESLKTLPINIQVAEDTRIIEQPQAQSICGTDGFALTVKAVGGDLHYQWYKDGQAIAGAVYSTYSKDVSCTSDFGQYHVEVEGRCGTVISTSIFVRPNEVTILSNWGTVLYVPGIDSTGSNRQYTGFQWYKMSPTGEMLPIRDNANAQYYKDPQGLHGTYMVEVTYANGEKRQSCVAIFAPSLTSVQSALKVYPNPAKTSETINISFENKPEGDYLLEIFDIAGKSVFSKKVSEDTTQVNLDVTAGSYVIKATDAKGNVMIQKIIVR